MRIVLLNQFYPPDVAPTGIYLHDLARALVARGHAVTVIASCHAYNGGGDFPSHAVLDGVEVQRLSGYAFGRGTLPGKFADYAAYYLRLAARLSQSVKPDLIVSLTTPPYLGLLGKWMADFRGARHSHWVMDLYPDVLHAHGLVAGFSLRALQSLARVMYADAHAIVTLGPAMAVRVGSYAAGSTCVRAVPLWASERLRPCHGDDAASLRRARGWETERLVLMYAGNFGLGHRFGEFLDAARRLGAHGPRWVFAGNGRARSRITDFAAAHPELPIEMCQYVPDALLPAHLCSADVHLVSMEAAWEGTLLPSKLQASFAVGRPVIFVGKPTLDVARWVLESEGGWVVNESDPAGLLRAIASSQEPSERERRGRNARSFAEARFAATANLERLVETLVPD